MLAICRPAFVARGGGGRFPKLPKTSQNFPFGENSGHFDVVTYPATNTHAPHTTRASTIATYSLLMNRSNRVVCDGSAASSWRYFIRLAMLPWHQLRAATGMLLITATRC